MADRLKRFAPVLAALVLLGWLLLLHGLDGFGGRSRFNRSPLALQVDSVRRAVEDAARLHREAAWADTLIGSLGPEPVSTGFFDDVGVRDSAAIMARLGRELAEAPARPKARLGVFTLPGSYGQYDTTAGSPVEYHIYTGVDADGPYCVVAGSSGPPSSTRPSILLFVDTADIVQVRRSQYSTILGPCRWWLRYGAPGERVGPWLEHRAYLFFDAPAEWLDESGRPPFRRLVFGARPTEKPLMSSLAFNDGCLAGRPDACMTLVNGVVRDSARIAAYERLNLTGPIGWADGALFAHVEREFGEERFARFWTSEQPPEQAFEAAFGLPMGEWVAGWARRHYGIEPRGPELNAAGVLLSLMLVAVCAAVSLWNARRRTVG